MVADAAVRLFGRRLSSQRTAGRGPGVGGGGVSADAWAAMAGGKRVLGGLARTGYPGPGAAANGLALAPGGHHHGRALGCSLAFHAGRPRRARPRRGAAGRPPCGRGSVGTGRAIHSSIRERLPAVGRISTPVGGGGPRGAVQRRHACPRARQTRPGSGTAHVPDSRAPRRRQTGPATAGGRPVTRAGRRGGGTPRPALRRPRHRPGCRGRRRPRRSGEARSRPSGSTYWRPRRPSKQHARIARQGAVPAPSPRAGGPQHWSAACEGAHTPALDLLIKPPDLTPREQEIAGLAARGLSSRAIAERLVISVRTVDNALQHVYGKLGLTSRAELRVALGLDSTREQPPE